MGGGQGHWLGNGRLVGSLGLGRHVGAGWPVPSHFFALFGYFGFEGGRHLGDNLADDLALLVLNPLQHFWSDLKGGKFALDHLQLLLPLLHPHTFQPLGLLLVSFDRVVVELVRGAGGCWCLYK